MLPHKVLLRTAALKVTAEAPNGHFCLLPRHIDFTALLAPGILSCVIPSGEELFMALAEGVLVKCGEEVLVSAHDGVRGETLGKLKETVEKHYKTMGERERKVRSVMARIETGFIRKFMEVHGHGGTE